MPCERTRDYLDKRKCKAAGINNSSSYDKVTKKMSSKILSANRAAKIMHLVPTTGAYRKNN